MTEEQSIILRENLEAKIEETLSGLRDFQKATVERIDHLFRNGQNRVLVADEVGLGKTFIAKGAIALTSRIRLDEGDDFFKVVYVCSNQNIARQNIQKLDVFGDGFFDDISRTRLSMQHLRVTEIESAAKRDGRYVQLTPLTPATSFHLTSGTGSGNERALIYDILSRIDCLKPYDRQLDQMMRYVYSFDHWGFVKYSTHERVESCKSGTYPSCVIDALMKRTDLIEALVGHLKNRPVIANEDTRKNVSAEGDKNLIPKLRSAFAEISVDMLNPDLVIMDEFQRFKELLDFDSDSETGLLTRKFLRPDKSYGAGENLDGLVRVLLLSATPYKMYSTPEEMQAKDHADPYREFNQVMKFLFSDEGKFEEFSRIWSSYSMALHQIKGVDSAILLLKGEAESLIYGAVSRTERLSVTGIRNDAFSEIEVPLTVGKGDILSYVEASKVIHEAHIGSSLPVDYIKSSPYIFSFMQGYKLKEAVDSYFKRHPENLNRAKGEWLWVNKRRIARYEDLPASNAKLESLKKLAFENNAAKLLWVPPSRPYYEPGGVFRGQARFSKILVFSAWEMVPRMISSLLSYESERLTVGKLCRNLKEEESKNASYFAKKGYPSPRMAFKRANDKAATMSLFCLLYPCKKLASLFDPVKHVNSGLFRMEELERALKQEMDGLLAPFKQRDSTITGPPDARWYYLLPMLLDRREDPDYVSSWLDKFSLYAKEARYSGNEESDGFQEKEYGRSNRRKDDVSALEAHIDAVRSMLSDDIELGKEPEDLLAVCVDMVLGSPAICASRIKGSTPLWATKVAQAFMSRFNTREATAIVELAYQKHEDDHWKDTLRYCKDGNFQSMMDEYVYTVTDGKPLDGKMMNQILESLSLRSAQYRVDSYEEFRRYSEGDKRGGEKSLRTSFAVCYTKSKGENDSATERRGSMQAAFNSPLRPFVLSSTSIGQEGLDFHLYCRRIFHWNLPSNPVELEQREGRIDRYKCLAIRQNVAETYQKERITSDIWKEMFKAAESRKRPGQSELVPFWCFGEGQAVKIERYVPVYPMSVDKSRYERLEKIRAYYRLSMGQVRQEDLMKYVFSVVEDDDDLKRLFFDLSPFQKREKGPRTDENR